MSNRNLLDGIDVLIAHEDEGMRGLLATLVRSQGATARMVATPATLFEELALHDPHLFIVDGDLGDGTSHETLAALGQLMLPTTIARVGIVDCRYTNWRERLATANIEHAIILPATAAVMLEVLHQSIAMGHLSNAHGV